MHWHPWRDLRERVGVRLVVGALPPGVWGATDGARTIWLHQRLTQAERRSTLAHELVHHDLGHQGCQPGSVEDRVRAIAARRLLPDVHQVADALAWAHTTQEAAEDLWVDHDTLQARLEHLTAGERRVIEERVERGSQWGT